MAVAVTLNYKYFYYSHTCHPYTMVNEITGSNYSLETEEVVSEKLENLLKYLGEAGDIADVETAEVFIMGFEVVSKGREKYTVKSDRILLITNSFYPGLQSGSGVPALITWNKDHP